jgi:uncharacterized RDD family membrane protein YckC
MAVGHSRGDLSAHADVTGLAHGRGPLTLGCAAVRQLASLLSSAILGVGYLMAGLRRDKRALHDLIAGTRVERLP